MDSVLQQPLNQPTSNTPIQSPPLNQPIAPIPQENNNKFSHISNYIKFILIFVILLVLGVGGYIFLPQNIKNQFSNMTPTPTIGIKPTSIPTPTEITVLPTSKYSDYFANPNESALDANGNFTPDAERIVMLTALRLSLAKYFVANKHYPSSLNDLFPQFAFKDEKENLITSPPLDPVTKNPYKFILAPDGLSYTLSATMSAGKEYTVTQEYKN